MRGQEILGRALEKQNYMSEVFDYILECLQNLLPEFKIANAVIHFDEASPHMHVVGVPVWEGAKRGLSKKVSKEMYLHHKHYL